MAWPLTTAIHPHLLPVHLIFLFERDILSRDPYFFLIWDQFIGICIFTTGFCFNLLNLVINLDSFEPRY